MKDGQLKGSGSVFDKTLSIKISMYKTYSIGQKSGSNVKLSFNNYVILRVENDLFSSLWPKLAFLIKQMQRFQVVVDFIVTNWK